MVKTLRITTFLIAAAAVALVIFLAAKGLASDKEIEKFLASPGIAAQLQAGEAGKAAEIGQETPLLRQAKAFALRINPPPPPSVAQPSPRQEIRPKAVVSAKFKLMGTSYYPGDENSSWALIDEVGKGWHWVRQGEKIGYLVVEKIGDGVVLIRDEENTYELAAEREQKPDYVESFSGNIARERTIPAWQGKESAVTEAISTDRTRDIGTENAQPQTEPEITKEQVQENINWLKQIQENPEALGMTAEEANELGDLGEFLKSFETELQTAEPNSPAKPNEPNIVSEPDLPKAEDANEGQDQGPQAPDNPTPRRPGRIERRR